MKAVASKRETSNQVCIKTSKALQNIVDEMCKLETEVGEYYDVAEFLSNESNLYEDPDDYQYITLGDACDIFNLSITTNKPIYEIIYTNDSEIHYFVGDLETELLPKFKRERDKLKGKLRAKIEEKKHAEEKEIERKLKVAEEEAQTYRKQLDEVKRGR